MWEKIKQYMKGVAMRLGMVKELKQLDSHKEIEIDESAYEYIEKNKKIYAGEPDWQVYKEYPSFQKTHVNRTMKTFNMGKKVSEKMAMLIFSEKVKMNIDNDEAKEFVESVLEDNDFVYNFPRYLEYMFALGGSAIKVYFDPDKEKIKLSYAPADAFFPLSNDSSKIDEALFVDAESKNGKFYTLLEFNEWDGDLYTIRNELYKSDSADKLGKQTNLSELYEDMEEETAMPDLRRPLYVYFKPNIANNKNLHSPLGISLYENCYDTLYLLDYMYDFWWHEFRMGKRKVAVSKALLYPIMEDERLRGMFDPEETIYEAVNDENDPVQDLTVDIRVEQIISGINAALDILAMQTGLNPGTFRFDGTGIKTATEVISQNSETYQTKNAHEQLVDKGIKDLITTIVDVGKLYKLYKGPDEFGVTLDFDDSIAQDRNQNMAYYSSMYNSKLMPHLYSVMRANDLTEKEAQEWIDMMKQENGSAVTDEMSDAFGVGAQNVGE
ncbi:MAG: phage portal protein [Tetragenococcus koreensis]|nr:phage portal protein [Tetragenococcus koreensis]